MRAIRPAMLVLVAIIGASLAWAANGLALSAGMASPRLSWTGLLSLAVLSGLTFWLGLRVYRSRTGKAREPIDPLLAARVLALGQACAHVGALIAGWHIGILAALGQAFAAGAAGTSVTVSAASVAGGAVMVACGIAVEFFCRIPPESGDKNAPEAEARP